MRSFPLATDISFRLPALQGVIDGLNDGGVYIVNNELAGYLEGLPSGCWPAVTAVDVCLRYESFAVLTPATAIQLRRLSSALRRIHIDVYGSAWKGPDLADALSGFAGSAPRLEGLTVRVSQARLEAGAAERAGVALACLQGLESLDLCWDGTTDRDGCAHLLGDALSCLTALSSLAVQCLFPYTAPSLSGCPTSLRALRLVGSAATHALGTLRCPGVTSLFFCDR